MSQRRRLLVGLGLGLAVLTTLPSTSYAFAPSSSARHLGSAGIGSVSSSSAFLGAGRFRVVTPQSRRDSGMVMFLGTDSGILGVGAPEIVSKAHMGHSILFQNVVSSVRLLAWQKTYIILAPRSSISSTHDMFISKTYRR